jgi:uncharacterized protein YdiU (UPF0061 family)
LQFDLGKQIDQDQVLIDRATQMNQVNPVLILRNHVLQSAIESAEMGDFSLVRQVAQMIRDPFNVTDEIKQKYHNFFRLEPKKIHVSCSS